MGNIHRRIIFSWRDIKFLSILKRQIAVTTYFSTLNGGNSKLINDLIYCTFNTRLCSSITGVSQPRPWYAATTTPRLAARVQMGRNVMHFMCVSSILRARVHMETGV